MSKHQNESFRLYSDNLKADGAENHNSYLKRNDGTLVFICASNQRHNAVYTIKEFLLLWAFVSFTFSTTDKQLCLQMSNDNSIPTNILQERRTIAEGTFPLLSAIMHRHIHGADGEINIKALFHPNISQAFEDTAPERNNVEKNPLYWMDEMRRAYTTWYEAGGRLEKWYPGHATSPTLLIRTPDDRLHRTWAYTYPAEDEEAEPYRDPKQPCLRPKYQYKLIDGHHEYTLNGPLVSEKGKGKVGGWDDGAHGPESNEDYW